MEFRPSATLKSRTFVGLLIAQFLAAFNDQAIHASAMFFSFHTHLMNEKEAISLMPILFYAPWAVFCTLAGWCADRFSKRHSLVAWKFAEVGICGVALLGFYLGDHHHIRIGPALVLACVFLMGMHSAFFVPAKYGIMPEILQPQILSRGNGLLESLSFLAVILGTVCGGVLSSRHFFQGHETWIGLILISLATIGAAASLLIRTVPAANPTRPFPAWIFAPLKDSMRMLFSARPLILAVVGIAFFTFVVAFMRQTVYMLGESQAPRWDEMKTSLIVGSTALGIGLGSPLAGYLSGRKIELGLVPLGGIGMVLAAVFATISIHWLPGLVAGIIAVGFFTGFYLVPLYSLLQHRAPRTSKGDSVAVSNFINVTGAILASFLFFILVSAFQKLGYARPIPFDDGRTGQLLAIKFREGRLASYEIAGVPKLPPKDGNIVLWTGENLPAIVDPEEEPVTVVEHRAEYAGKMHVYLRTQDEPEREIYDNSALPGFLFIGAAVITLLILIGLCIVQPDLPRRATWAFRSFRGPRVRANGTHNVPISGPALLITNCHSTDDVRRVQSATDRIISFPAADASNLARDFATGKTVGLMDCDQKRLMDFKFNGPAIPTYVGPISSRNDNEILVSFGPPMAACADSAKIANAIREAATAKENGGGH